MSQVSLRRCLFVLPCLAAVGAIFVGCHRVDAGAAEAPAGKSAVKDDPKNEKKGGSKRGDAAARVVPVLTAKVVRRDLPIWLEGLGTVSAWQQVTVRPQVDGRLDKVFFKDGQEVKRGDLLAQIDPRPFKVQLQQAEGALVRDRSQLEGATLNLSRNSTLLKENLVAQQAVDDLKTLVGQSSGAVKIDQAAIGSARLNLDYARVRAPIDGVVGVRLIDAGNLVRASDATGLVVLTQLDPAAVFVTLPQDDLPKVLAARRRGEVPIEVFGRDGKQRIAAGKLAAIDNQINPSTSTLRLKALVPNPDHELWPNQFLKARILVDVKKGALVVPAAAVRRGPQGAFVYVVEADKTAGLRSIEVDLVTGDVAVISDLGKDKGQNKQKIEAGVDVVVEGQGQLRPGAPVSPRSTEKP